MYKQLSILFKDKEKIGSFLLIGFGFSLPLSVAVNNLLAILIIIFWLYKKDFSLTWSLTKNSKVVISILIFVMLHAIGLFWTQDMSWGLHMLGKEWKFLLLPIMMSFVKKEHIRYYISAFLLAMSISEIISYLIWFEFIPPIYKATVYDPTPFVHHTSYNPFLAFAIYLIGYLVFFDKSFSRFQKVVFIFFFITMSVNMFITGGRAGQGGYIVVILILFLQFFNKHPLRAILMSTLLLGSVVTIAYNTSQVFHDRMNLVVSNVKNFKQNKNTSVGLRMNFAINTFEIIKKHPIIGVGTGDFKQEYMKINMKNTPTVCSPAHPHNMYLLEMAQFGLFGLFSLIFILYTQIKFSIREDDHFKKSAGFVLPILFAVIMISDCYLLGHFTTMLFIFFSSFLYRPLE